MSQQRLPQGTLRESPRIVWARFATVLAIFFCANSFAQLPQTKLYLFDIGLDNKAINMRLIGADSGYNNQPNFSPDGNSLLFTSNFGKGKTDIWSYDLASGKTTPLTSTVSESEYSPFMLDNGQIVVVHVLPDDSTQTLHVLSSNPFVSYPLLALDRPIGYFAVANDSIIASFVLGKTNDLAITNLHSHETKIVAKDIGRTLTKVPGNENEICFVQMQDSTWHFHTINIFTDSTDFNLPFADVQDFGWYGGVFIAAAKNGQVSIEGGYDKGKLVWINKYDLTQTPAREFYRLAISRDGKHLAVVAYAGKKP